MARPREKYWYALKVFYNRVDRLREDFKAARYDTFVPMTRVKEGSRIVDVPLIPSLLFVKCSAEYLENLQREKWDVFMFYKEADSRKPGAILDHEMDVFRLATSAAAEGAEFLGTDTDKYMVGDKVRVTDGPYKGYEGYVRRIRHDRKLIVCVQGIAVVAFPNVKIENVEKI